MRAPTNFLPRADTNRLRGTSPRQAREGHPRCLPGIFQAAQYTRRCTANQFETPRGGDGPGAFNAGRISFERDEVGRVAPQPFHRVRSVEIFTNALGASLGQIVAQSNDVRRFHTHKRRDWKVPSAEEIIPELEERIGYADHI